MDELIAFLRAGYDEDEQTAYALAGATIVTGRSPDFHGAGGPAAMDFWRHFTPRRTIADVAAKRAILRAVITQLLDDPDDDTAAWMVRQLAAPYADHPEFREEWKP